MKYLQYDFTLSAAEAVKVNLSAQANVKLMDYSNFQAYRNGNRHQYYGGRATVTPYIVRPPHAGRWYLAIDLGGYAGNISA